jgi:ABC-type nitrate/sulfonate/bicarbonate transport system substrate-binding protein
MDPRLRIAAHAGGSEGIEKHRLRIGFVPLADCAPLVWAKERGHFRRHGLEVELSREVSWASLRDKVAAGALDAAQMLAPMPFAAALGLGGPELPISTGYCLGLGGNAITVSDALYRRLADVDPEALVTRPVTATALRELILLDREAGRPPLRFGIVFPYSTHDLELRYWLASAGIDPDRDVSLRVVAPPLMVQRLEEGHLDGYCVGEPWNALAAARGSGRALVTKHEIWNHSPEKVFGVAESWLENHPGTHRALLRALLEAAVEIDDPERRLEVAHVIAGESFVDAPVEVMRRSLAPLGRGAGPIFYRNAATHPWISHAAWLLSQMVRWGYVEKPIDLRALARRVYRPDLHREAAADLGLPAPLVDEKIEGVHGSAWILDEASAPIAMGSDHFFDGLRFDPDEIVEYLERFAISALRVRIDELAEIN